MRKNTTHFYPPEADRRGLYMSSPKLLIFVGIICLGTYGLALATDPNTEYSEYQQYQKVDLNKDGIIAFEDLAIFAQNWLLSGSGLTGDFDDSNLVDYADLAVMVDCWLKGNRPEGIWEQFKAALGVGDVNTALTFIAETSRDKYAEIFLIIGPSLPDYAAGMGDLILKSDSEVDGEVKYEMTHQVGSGTYLFPVIFIKDEHWNWQIYNF